MPKKITVIGAGVVGLTSAISLQEQGFSVTVVSKDMPTETVSCVACAFWYPYIVKPEEKAAQWSIESLHRFVEESRNFDSGIFAQPLHSIFTHSIEDPLWSSAVEGYRRMTSEELPNGYTDGFAFKSYVIETPIYLPFLLQTFLDNGGQLKQDNVSDITTLFYEADVVVNCTGMGAETLCSDTEMTPVRGQVLSMTKPNLDHIVFDTENVSYIVPRSNDCIVGGTAEEGERDISVSCSTTDSILQKCSRLVPSLEDVTLLDAYAGLRPVRSAVRLETEEVAPGKTVVHNYGHGGAGITLCWGCAHEVVEMISKVAPVAATIS